VAADRAIGEGTAGLCIGTAVYVSRTLIILYQSVNDPGNKQFSRLQV
jgi:hypothetical protein